MVWMFRAQATPKLYLCDGSSISYCDPLNNDYTLHPFCNLTGLPNGISYITWDPTAGVNGLFYGIDQNGATLYSIDPSGTVSTVGATGIGDYLYASVANVGGHLYIQDSGAGLGLGANLYSVNKSTGAATLVGSNTASDYLAYNSSNSTLYALGDGVGGDKIFTINTSTGASTFVANQQAGTYGVSCGSFNNGTLWAMDGGYILSTINPSTGNRTTIHTFSGTTYWGMAWR
jgi:hypothetical protein